MLVEYQRPQESVKTNFDAYLEAQLKEPEFAARFERAGEAWNVALKIVESNEETANKE